MKVQRDKLHQYQKRIAHLTDRETAIAKECLSRGQKSKALLALRQKKYQESLLARTDLQLQQLQQLTSDIEFSMIQKDIVFGLQQGTKVLKQIQAEIGGIENVEKLLADNEEARAYQKEVSDMLGGKMSNEDEDEVEDELEALDRAVYGVKEPEAPRLPDAPRLEPKVADTDAEGQKAVAAEKRVQRAKVRARERAKAAQAVPA